MEVSFADRELERLWMEVGVSTGLPSSVISSFRRKVGFLLQARDTRDLGAMRSLNFEKLKGKRQHECSIRLNDQYRLVFEMSSEGGKQRIILKSIEDYH